MADGYILTKGAVQTFLQELNNILNQKQSELIIVEREDKPEGYNLSDCKAELGIDDDCIKEYLKNLTLEEYVETCDDERNKKSNAYYVIGKIIMKRKVYIKVKIQSYDKKIILCMSFHFAEDKMRFPYK